MNSFQSGEKKAGLRDLHAPCHPVTLFFRCLKAPRDIRIVASTAADFSGYNRDIWLHYTDGSWDLSDLKRTTVSRSMPSESSTAHPLRQSSSGDTHLD